MTGYRYVVAAVALLTLCILVEYTEAYTLEHRVKCDWICKGLDIVTPTKNRLAPLSNPHPYSLKSNGLP